LAPFMCAPVIPAGKYLQPYGLMNRHLKGTLNSEALSGCTVTAFPTHPAHLGDQLRKAIDGIIVLGLL
jgi:hypothetical protein